MEIQQQITLQNYCPHLFFGRWGAGCGGAVLTVTGPQNLTMQYAANGNITGKSDLGTANQFIYGNSARPYRLTGLETNTNLVPVTLQQITYTSFEQPLVITESPYQATFAYNTEGQRALMTVSVNGGTILTRWYAGRYIRETAGSTIKQFTWIGGDAYTAPCIAIKTNTGSQIYYYLLRDHLGTITHVTNESGTVLNEYSFDAWGRRRNFSNWSYTVAAQTDLLPARGFTAHEWLTWFNLYNMNGRLYDPVVGRFLSPDNYVQMPDFSQNFNRYSYCLNNPLRYNDPDGEWIHLLIGGLIGGVANWAANGAQFSWEGLGYFGIGAAAGALGAGVGAGISSALAGGSFGAGFMGSSAAMTATTSFTTGAAIGSGAGFSSGFTTGFGNGLMGGQNFGQALWSGTKTGLIGGASGALLGGLVGGIDAAVDRRNFWHGGRKTTDVSMLLPPTNQIGELDCRYETFRSVDTYYNSESSSVSDLRIDYPNAEKSTYQLQRMYNSKGMSLQDLGVTPDMTKSEIAQRMASSMQNNNAIHYEFRIGSGGHAVGVNRIRVWDNGKIHANFMNPSGAGGYSARNFRQLLNVFSVLKF